MPNVKIYVDSHVNEKSQQVLANTLESIRDMVCAELKVPAAACQIAVLSVIGLIDQPQANVEIQILPKPDRTPERVREICLKLQEAVSGALGVGTAVRAAALDPETYIALK